MTSLYPNSTAVLPPYANPNGISALSTGTYDASQYAQAYVGGKRKRTRTRTRAKAKAKSKSRTGKLKRNVKKMTRSYRKT